MYKKASKRTGGSSSSGWSTRKQREPKVDRNKIRKLIANLDKTHPRRENDADVLSSSGTVLLKKGSGKVVRQKSKFRKALMLAAEKIHEAAEVRRERYRKHRLASPVAR
jgi:hypothetical protein